MGWQNQFQLVSTKHHPFHCFTSMFFPPCAGYQAAFARERLQVETSCLFPKPNGDNFPIATLSDLEMSCIFCLRVRVQKNTVSRTRTMSRKRLRVLETHLRNRGRTSQLRHPLGTNYRSRCPGDQVASTVTAISRDQLL